MRDNMTKVYPHLENQIIDLIEEHEAMTTGAINMRLPVGYTFRGVENTLVIMSYKGIVKFETNLLMWVLLYK
jgi:hypothetical protein